MDRRQTPKYLRHLFTLPLTALVSLSHASDTSPAIDFAAALTTDWVSPLQGGNQRTSTTMHNLDLTWSLDGEQLLRLPGSSFFLYILGNTGNSASEQVGDAQTLSNIDAPSALKIYELWYEQRFARDLASIKTGLIDLNSEFDVIESAGLFVNSSHGIGPDFSQTGQNGPSIFPTTALALRLQYQFHESLSLAGAVFDAVPGDVNEPQGTHVRISSADGALSVVEARYQVSAETGRAYRKLALGSWRYSASFTTLPDAEGNSEASNDNQGFYLLGEYQLTQEHDPNQGLTAFGRYGHANADINPLSHYRSLGVVYTGMIPGRDEDSAGIAFAQAVNGERFRDNQATEDTRVEAAETVVELSYRAPITPWLSLQPDLQYIQNPGMNAGLDNALVFLLRLEVSID